MHIAFYSDIICPWCYIGKRKLEKAIEFLDAWDKVDLHIYPYQLYPNIPKGGVLRSEWKSSGRKGMGKILRESSKDLAIQFDFSKIKMIPNSINALNLLSKIRDGEVKWKLKTALFKAYFEDGQDVEDPDSLTEIAKKAKVDDVDIKAFQRNLSNEEPLRTAIRLSREKGITAVPAFYLNHQDLIVGAHETSKWIRFLERRIS